MAHGLLTTCTWALTLTEPLLAETKTPQLVAVPLTIRSPRSEMPLKMAVSETASSMPGEVMVPVMGRFPKVIVQEVVVTLWQLCAVPVFLRRVTVKPGGFTTLELKVLAEVALCVHVPLQVPVVNRHH